MSAASPCSRSRSSWITIRRASCENPLWMLYVATVKRTGSADAMASILAPPLAAPRVVKGVCGTGMQSKR